MLKKLFKIIFAVFLLASLVRPVLAKENQVNLYLFWSKTCPHCEKEISFLEKIKPDYPNLTVHDFEVGSSRDNALLLREVGQEMNVDVGGVPMTFIGEEYFPGYLSDTTTGAEIVSLIEKYTKEGDPDVVGKMLGLPEVSPLPTKVPTPSPVGEETTPAPILPEDIEGNDPDVCREIELPLLGTISLDTKKTSLPVLTFIIALLDGFNPCAMWVLLFLISLLLGMKDRKKMWILGSVFILTSGFVYFLFLTAWLNLFLFLGFVTWVRILIGVTALAMGVYQLWDYATNKDASCKVTGGAKRKKVFDGLKSIAQKKRLLIAILGMILLAFAVNLVELVCSAGLPAIYTQLLSLTPMPKWQYYSYLLFYIFIFMVDDLVVFAVAMLTLKAVGLESKYARFSRLVGGLLILAIGILMLLKPEVLMFI
ncbi:hypothetical protein KKB40_04825 [Patescibacteria group bacterium]|nr:hypothetical protein [Patescibacteria group bacterium]